jgi:NAD+ kinase
MKILLVVNPGRPEALNIAHELINIAQKHQIQLFSATEELLADPVLGKYLLPYQKGENVDCALVFGGDGTILRAAEICHGTSIPIIGFNVGNVGFLAEIHNPEIEKLCEILINKTWRVEPRMTLDYSVTREGKVINKGWALNEVTTERTASQMVELYLAIDNSPISKWGCDSVISATPTGSTAYAFSAGGPVVWPQVEAMIIVPVANHGLFSRPMVISDKSEVTLDIESSSAQLVADGIRTFSLVKGDKITLTVSPIKIDLAHIDDSVFADRLVAKFKLPISGWRR